MPTGRPHWMLAVIAGAIASLVGCDSTQPNLRKSTIVGSGGRLVEPKRCALSVVILTRPQSDPALDQAVWTVADEQIVEPSLRRALQANGLRIGRITGDLPQQVESLLRTGPPDQPDVQTVVIASGQDSVIDPTHAAARSSLNLLLSGPDGKVKGKIYEDAKAYLRVTPAHEGTKGVALRVVPELRHGPMQQGFGMVPQPSVAVPREFQLTQSQKEETFRELATEIVLEPGQVAVLGVRTDRPGSLGDLLFQRTEPNSDRVRQSLVLIWAQRNEKGVDPLAPDSAKATSSISPVEPR